MPAACCVRWSRRGNGGSSGKHGGVRSPIAWNSAKRLRQLGKKHWGVFHVEQKRRTAGMKPIKQTLIKSNYRDHALRFGQ